MRWLWLENPVDSATSEIQIGEQVRRELWLDGRPEKTLPLLQGDVCTHDLRREAIFRFHTAAHSILFYLPRKTLDFIADDANAPRIGDIIASPGLGLSDQTLATIARILMPAFRDPDQVSRLFIDHVALAAAAHVARTYGGMTSSTRQARGGLASWQERRAKQILTSCLDGGLPIAQLAGECGLSPSHFSRLFKQSTGLTPHQWPLRYRIDIAKRMLRETGRSLTEIALACGFSEQSHFSRTYARLTGESPGAARRTMVRGDLRSTTATMGTP